jgi:hypothetical protein
MMIYISIFYHYYVVLSFLIDPCASTGQKSSKCNGFVHIQMTENMNNDRPVTTQRNNCKNKFGK